MVDARLGATPIDDERGSGWEVVARYPRYEEAQRAVDYLSDSGFAVENVEVIGRDVRLVERVTGRRTIIDAALAGAASGMWFGLFVGLLMALFTPAVTWLAIVLTALVIGGVTGALFGGVAHWTLRGRRDFDSTFRLAAGHYDLRVADEHVAEARELLSRMR
jgi:hypothetical protein